MARLVGTGQVEFFGAPSARFRGSGNPRLFGATGLPAQPGPGNRSSSEPRAPSLIGVRQTALFGGPRAEPHRDQGSGALRSVASRFHRDRVTAPLRRNGNHVSPGAGSPGLTGVRQAALFGGSCAEPHRDMAIGALRSPGRRIPPRQGSLISSGNRSLAPLGVREGRRLAGKGHMGVRPHLGGWRSERTPAHVGAHTGQDGNGRKAKAAVMQYGC
jgi:hypothetical protein